MTKTYNSGLGLSYPVSVLHVPQKGMEVSITANAQELTALAKNHGLLEVKSFKVDFLITRWKRDGIKIRGRLRASITQACVATLEPIDNKISENIETVLVPETSRLARIRLDESGEMLLDAEGPDMPETFSGDRIDFGAVAEEFFELSIDPYARKVDAEFINIIESDDEDDAEDQPVSPFASLAKWQSKRN